MFLFGAMITHFYFNERAQNQQFIIICPAKSKQTIITCLFSVPFSIILFRKTKHVFIMFIHSTSLLLYSIYIFACLCACLFVTNKRQILCGTWHDPRDRRLCKIKVSKITVQQIWFSINFENPRFFFNPRTFFVIVLQCIQREKVHNWNRRRARTV